MAEDDATGNGGKEASGTENGGDGNAAERLIARFGGLRPMASKLGIAVSTVQGWKTRGHVPPARTEEIRRAAAEHGIALDEAELAAATAEQPSADEPTGQEAAAGTLEAEHVDGPSPWGAAPKDGEEQRDEAEAASDERPAAGEDDRSAKPEPAGAAAGTGAPAAARPADRQQGSRAGAWIGGLLLGALLLGGGLVAAVYTQPYWQPYVDANLPDLNERVGDALQPLEERLQALESEPAPQPSADSGDLEQQVASLQASLEELRTRLSELPAEGQGGADGSAVAAELEPLRERLSALEQELSSGSAASDRLAALEEQVTQLGDTLAASGADPQALERFRGEVARLSARFDDLSGTTEQLRQALARVEVVQSELASVKSRLDDLAGQVGAIADQRLAELDRRVAANAEAIEQRSEARNRGALLALALGQLREALRFSEPYAQELQGVRGVAAGADLSGLIEPLEAQADSGVANLTTLRRRFSELAPDIVGASYASGEQGWFREVMDRVPELVTVRPVGQATGDSVGARVARAEQALASGDLPAAVSEIASLEGEPAEVAAPWLEAARNRLAADEALAELTRRAITQLSGDRQGADSNGAAPAGAAQQTGSGG